MQKTYVEFYFPGISCSGQNEQEVASRDIEAISKTPENAISFRFFDKDEKEHKVNYSHFYFFGNEYSSQEFKQKFPQVASNPDLANTDRIVHSVTGGFYPLSSEDVVVSKY